MEVAVNVSTKPLPFYFRSIQAVSVFGCQGCFFVRKTTKREVKIYNLFTNGSVVISPQARPYPTPDRSFPPASRHNKKPINPDFKNREPYRRFSFRFLSFPVPCALPGGATLKGEAFGPSWPPAPSVPRLQKAGKPHRPSLSQPTQLPTLPKGICSLGPSLSWAFLLQKGGVAS